MVHERNLCDKFTYHCVHEVIGQSSDAHHKNIFYIVCRYIFDYVPPPLPPPTAWT